MARQRAEEIFVAVECSFPNSDFEISVCEEFYREYPNLIGFNYSEQFWGYGDSNPMATAWPDRITHFAPLPLSEERFGCSFAACGLRPKIQAEESVFITRSTTKSPTMLKWLQ
jgi:hypothetical protein